MTTLLLAACKLRRKKTRTVRDAETVEMDVRESIGTGIDTAAGVAAETDAARGGQEIEATQTSLDHVGTKEDVEAGVAATTERGTGMAIDTLEDIINALNHRAVEAEVETTGGGAGARAVREDIVAQAKAKTAIVADQLRGGGATVRTVDEGAWIGHDVHEAEHM